MQRPYPAPSSGELLAALRGQSSAVRSLRAEARMSHRARGETIKATVRLMAELPDRLRFDLVSPFDTPLATLVARDGRFALIDAREDRYYYGPASPCNLARLLQVALEPRDVIAILGASAPILSHRQAEVSWDSRAALDVLTLRGTNAQQTLWLRRRGPRWLLWRMELRSRDDGKLLLATANEDYRQHGQLWLPKTIIVDQPATAQHLTLSFRRQELNLSLPATAFAWPDAGRLPRQHVTCSSSANNAAAAPPAPSPAPPPR